MAEFCWGQAVLGGRWIESGLVTLGADNDGDSHFSILAADSSIGGFDGVEFLLLDHGELAFADAVTVVKNAVRQLATVLGPLVLKSLNHHALHVQHCL